MCDDSEPSTSFDGEPLIKKFKIDEIDTEEMIYTPQPIFEEPPVSLVEHSYAEVKEEVEDEFEDDVEDEYSLEENSNEGASIPEVPESQCGKNALGKTPMDYVELFLPPSLIELIISATNKNADEIISQLPAGSRHIMRVWRATNLREIKSFLGLSFLMTILRLHRMDDYWLKHYLVNLQVRRFISKERYHLVAKNLRFNWLSSSNDVFSYDALYDVRPLLKSLNDIMEVVNHSQGEVSILSTSVYGAKMYIRTTASGLVEKVDLDATNLLRDDSGHYIPKLQSEFWNFIAGVDWSEILRESGMSFRKRQRDRLSKMAAMKIIMIMVNNAWILYNEHRTSKCSARDFLLEVITNYLPAKANLKRPDHEVHLPELLPRAGDNRTMRKRCKYCVEVFNHRNDSIYGCSRCLGFPGFCLVPCFRLYHKYK